MSIKAVSGSIVVYRRVKGLYKVSKRRSEVLKEGIVGVGVPVQVCIRVYYTFGKTVLRLK